MLAAVFLAYHIVHSYVLGGTGGWDYLSYDAQHKHLFISRGTHVMVVDPYAGTVIGDIPGTPGVHGIAVVSPSISTLPTGAGTDATRFYAGGQLAFAPNGRDATLTIVHEDSPDTFTVVQNAATQTGARTMEIDPDTGAVFFVAAKVQINPNATGYRDRYHVIPGTFTLLVLEPT
jgi:hypothetical protein